MFKKLTIAWVVIFTVFLYGKNAGNSHEKHMNITKKMIEGKVFYSRYEGNSFYIQSKFSKIDPKEGYGEVVYIMMDSPKSISGNTEYVSYWLKKGKILVYGNDGSATRYTLISIKPDRWILIEEEDMDGIDKQFGFKKLGKETWYFKKPKGYPELEKCKPFEGECFVEASKFPV